MNEDNGKNKNGGNADINKNAGRMDDSASKFTKKNIIFASIIVLIAIIGGVFVLKWYLYSLNHVYTEDAQVDGHIYAVSSMVSGNIRSIYVHKNEPVKKGELLAVINQSTYYPEMLQAKANYDLAKQNLFNAGGSIGEFAGTAFNNYYLDKLNLKKASSTLSAAKLTFKLDKRDYLRGLKLLSKEFITREQFDTLKTSYLVARQNYYTALTAYMSARRSFVNAQYTKSIISAKKYTTIKPLEAAIKVADAAYKLARANYLNTFIKSPINGVVSEKMSYLGEYITPGTPILMINNLKKVWVTANVKETLIANVKKGDPVVVTVDSFPGKIFKGAVEFVGSVTTSKFALIPTNNPSGTYTKVTHRLPVRIRILNDKNHILKPGMMVEVSIKTGK
ncbi:MAG: HlyD family secretion protein [Candidatus Acididesulfobacter guangdongensis]|uniref:HlyD family secretion protein n=1 Tax=Acididesulfobacter guangdongensis TaxID=2597225 RepID=A0A519BIT7_ACIG2|nr:MAG: HlyD family secretion protein [Candidatus Acididesulfobacter guangdongensis]